MAICRILHLSDLHIRRGRRAKGTITGGYSEEKAKALAHWAFNHGAQGPSGRQFDAILVTGDLAHWGTDEYLRASHEYLYGKVGAGKLFETALGSPTLQGAGVPVHVMPGNHDRYQDLYGNPGCLQFDQVFGAVWPTGLRRVHALPPIRSSHPDYEVVVIAADCCLERQGDERPRTLGAVDRRKAILGQGMAGKPIADLLRQETAAVRSRRDGTRRIVVWAVHFPPTEFDPAVSHDLKLNHASWIGDAAGELRPGTLFAQVPLVLSGHLHKEVGHSPLPVGSGASVWCGASAFAIDHVGYRVLFTTEHGFHIVQLEMRRQHAQTLVQATRRNFRFEKSGAGRAGHDIVEQPNWRVPNSRPRGPNAHGLVWRE